MWLRVICLKHWMESCDLRLAIVYSTDVDNCSTGARCWPRTLAALPDNRGSAMAALLNTSAFRQYSGEVEDLTSMSRQRVVQVLRASLFNAACRLDLRPYIDSGHLLGFSTRRYFSRDRDVMLTSSGDDSSDDDVIKHRLRGDRAWNRYGMFRLPTFAEFLAENVAEQLHRNRSPPETGDHMSNIKVSEGQRQHIEVARGQVDGGVSSSISQPLKTCIDNAVTLTYSLLLATYRTSEGELSSVFENSLSEAKAKVKARHRGWTTSINYLLKEKNEMRGGLAYVGTWVVTNSDRYYKVLLLLAVAYFELYIWPDPKVPPVFEYIAY